MTHISKTKRHVARLSDKLTIKCICSVKIVASSSSNSIAKYLKEERLINLTEPLTPVSHLPQGEIFKGGSMRGEKGLKC